MEVLTQVNSYATCSLELKRPGERMGNRHAIMLFFHYIHVSVHSVGLYDTDLLEAYKLNFYMCRLL